LHPPARARTGARAHRDPELHARHGRGPRGALCPRAGGRPDPQLLRHDAAWRRTALPGASLRRGGPGAGERGRPQPEDGAARGPPAAAGRGPDRPGDRAPDAGGAVLMPAHLGRRTKIVATIGPASNSPEVLRELLEAGVDVFRINFAHGTA